MFDLYFWKEFNLDEQNYKKMARIYTNYTQSMYEIYEVYAKTTSNKANIRTKYSKTRTPKPKPKGLQISGRKL